MLLRTLGIAVLFTGLAAAQAPAAERASRGPNRDARTARALNQDMRVARAPNQDMRTARAPDARQTPAERASRTLNRDMRADRFYDAARDARGDGTPVREEIQQFLPQRRTLQPDVGRPEQDGRLSTEGIRGGLPSMGSNPQR